MDEGGEGLLHADWRASAADVARQGQQLLHRDEVAALIAGDFGGLLEVHLFVAWDDADEVARFVAFQHQGLEHLVDVLAQLVGDVLRAQVVPIDFVGDELIRNLLLVKKPARIGFVDFFFRHAFSYYFCANIRKLLKPMKKRYTFSSGETIEADLDDLRRLLEENRRYLENYAEVLGSLEDDDYVARGNGFCDRKYSDDFVEGQMEKYERRVKEIEGWIENY